MLVHIFERRLRNTHPLPSGPTAQTRSRLVVVVALFADIKDVASGGFLGAGEFVLVCVSRPLLLLLLLLSS